MVVATKGRVLLVDDEPAARSGIEKLLELEGYDVDTAESGDVALPRALERAPDVVVTDLRMPGMDGIALIRALKEKGIAAPVIVVTAFGDVSSSVEAMRAGAEDYLTKPVDVDVLLLSIERALQGQALRLETERLRQQLHQSESIAFGGMLGASSAMQKVYRAARQIAGARATVLITGESGTGKGALAKAIHDMSPRKDKPFVSLHCASLAESLLESELFGHEKGSFTGADRKRLGRFEQAHGGTLFLDEVGEIPMATQVKLLRVLQERKFERVGGNETLSVDVRLIAATNRDLQAAVAEGRLREDLFYRLNVVHLEMPPLRVRDTDVIMLANHFLRRFSRDNHRTIEGFTDAARDRLLGHPWPGNVRELENAIERAVVLCDGELIEEEHLPIEVAPSKRGAVTIPGSSMAEIEKHAILSTLESTKGSTTRAAQILGISVRTIQYRLHDYGVAPPKSRPSEHLRSVARPGGTRAA